jgi:hypothetical protein
MRQQQADNTFSEAEINNALGNLNLNRSNSDGLPELMQMADIVAALDAERQRLNSDEDIIGSSLLNSFQELSLRN